MIVKGGNIFYYFIFSVIALVIALLRKDLRKEMLWAGLLSLPVLLIKPLISNDFFNVANQNSGIFWFMLQRAIIGFSFGALASAIYESVFHKRISPQRHPHRPKMIWLALGIVVFFAFYFLIRTSFVESVIAALVYDIVILLIIRKDLVWDLIFSGAMLGTLYLIIFSALFRGIPGDSANFWFSTGSIGLTLFSIPVEELIAVMLFGALWGPLYIAFKDLKEK